MWVRVGVSEGREQVQFICVPQTRVPDKVSSALSGSPGSLGVGARGPSGLCLQVLKGRGPVRFLQVPQTQVLGPGRVFITLGPIWARADAEGAPGRGYGRPRRVPGARAQRDASRPAPHRPPGPLPALTALGAPRWGPAGPLRPR